MIVHVPPLTVVNTPAEVMVQTLAVVDVKVTVRPALDVAVRVGLVPKVCGPGSLKVIVCPPLGVTEFDTGDAALVPALFVAVTVKV